MKARQVFKTYDTKDQSEKRKFCALCGAECTLKQDNGNLRLICSNCDHIHYRNPSPAVSVLVVDSSQFLLCRRSAGYFQGGKWSLPSGFMEFQEDYLTAARREVKEETGLDVEIQSIISVVSNFFNPDLHTLVIVLLAQPVGGKLSLGDPENDKLQWFSEDDELPEMAFEADSHIIRRYFETHLKGAPVDPDYARGGSG